MRFGLPQHLILFVVANVALFVLNLAPVDFDLNRPDVPLWFLYPLIGWGVLLLVHGVLVATGIVGRSGPARDPATEPESARAPRPAPIDPSKAGRAGILLADCRREAGQALAALGAVGGVPVDVDDLLRGAISQAEHVAERLAPVYGGLASDDANQELEAQRSRLEGALEALELGLKVIRLEAQVLEDGSDEDPAALSGPLEQLRVAIMAAAEAVAA